MQQFELGQEATGVQQNIYAFVLIKETAKLTTWGEKT